jgi:diketogulonate reductase-like aldo/keto reductase
MREESLGATGVSVPVVGQGTASLLESPRRQGVAALRAGIAAGARHVDTAEMYGGGRVEELVGEALADCRHDAFLATKLMPRNADRKNTRLACEVSLRRLRTEYVDLYLLHWYGPHPLAETFEAFEALREQGKIRAWGVSNFDEVKLAEAVAVAGEGKIACNQVLYHLLERSVEHAVIPYCRRHGIAVVAYSPFGSGRFPAPESDGGRALAKVGERRGAAPRQVALAFLLREPGTFAIPRSANPEHARENAAAGGIGLSREDRCDLDAAFPRGPRRPGVPLLGARPGGSDA